MIETGGGSSSETGWSRREYVELTESRGPAPHRWEILYRYRMGWLRWAFAKNPYGEAILEPAEFTTAFLNGWLPFNRVKVYPDPDPKPVVRSRW
jgi:hypothetical protein